jgi:hypothetical protein
MSPCTAKLSGLRGKQLGRYVDMVQNDVVDGG